MEVAAAESVSYSMWRSLIHFIFQKMLIKKIYFFKVTFTDDGLDAIIFTAEGDMRQAINNLQGEFMVYLLFKHS